jgi:GxxExxY protein
METNPAVRDAQTYAIIGAAMEVHRCLGAGFLEAVYREAMRRELQERNIPFQPEVRFRIPFKGRHLAIGFQADLACYGEIVVELKALRAVGRSEEAQVINYLKASGMARGLLFNFGHPRLEYRRFVLGPIESAETRSRPSADGADTPVAPESDHLCSPRNLWLP